MNLWIARGAAAGMLASSLMAGTLPDGLYLHLDTAFGTSTFSIDTHAAPIAVANLVGLATGSRAWMDEGSGKVRTDPFFDGLEIDTIDPGAIIGFGSRDSSRMDGPGYRFQEEVDSGRIHDTPYLLTMLPQGVNGNGSRLAITLAPLPAFDGWHTILGQAVAGTNVLQTLAGQPVDAEDRPVPAIVIQAVRIERVGAAAQDFDETQAPDLPIAAPLEISGLEVDASGLGLAAAFRAPSVVHTLISTQLPHTVRQEVTNLLSGPLPVQVLAGHPAPAPVAVAALSEVFWDRPLFNPGDIQGRSLTLNLDNGQVIRFDFDHGGTGTFDFQNGLLTGNITEYTLRAEPVRLVLDPLITTGLPPLRVELATESANADRCTGAFLLTPEAAIRGSYGWSP